MPPDELARALVPRWLPACRVVLLLHVALAVAAWWLLPKGFPFSHPRFCVNSVLPAIAVGGGIAALVELYRGRYALFQNVLLALCVAWTMLPAAYVWVFPISGRLVAAPCVVVALMMWFICGAAFRSTFYFGPGAAFAIGLALVVGLAFPCSQCGDDPTTMPAFGGLGSFYSTSASGLWTGGKPAAVRAIESLSPDLTIRPRDGSIAMRCGVSIDVQPLMSFDSRSPDRNWSILGPVSESRPVARQTLSAWQRRDGMFFHYRDLADQTMLIVPMQEGAAAQIEVRTQFDWPIYSHLNSFTELTVSGHERLYLSFSPCPEVHVEALPAGYPYGEPAQLAYLDASGVFHVVQASSGEKGPFRELGRGPLERNDALTITFHNGEQAVCRIQFLDWAAQASTDLSPTAGWGLPQNAIEFLRQGPNLTSSVGIWITLAGTSVGRGWDTVGHAAGVYRNRITIEPAQ